MGVPDVLLYNLLYFLNFYDENVLMYYVYNKDKQIQRKIFVSKEEKKKDHEV